MVPDTFIETLPDPAGARRFVERLRRDHPAVAETVLRHQSLLARLLVLATHSPFLAETMLRQPEYIEWISHERDLTRLKSKEELFEGLARFAAIHSTLNEQAMLSRFKRREFLRIYLRDCFRLATLTETTLELSNLADILLQHALWHCHQQLVNHYGTPQTTDARGRIRPAEFAIVALGKLGSQELNYASDIDLLYLYSHSGTTSQGKMTNKEFFAKLAERITQVVGGVAEEGAVYRIDLRLRPHGRAGEIVVSLDEAVQYYRQAAQTWERQALIRARAAAGDEALVQRFLKRVKNVMYPLDPLPALLGEIRSAKDKIDRDQRTDDRGIDVKLGKGGIREIEFIAQALQLYHGGREPWIHHGQILIGLHRLADKRLISDTDRARLSEAYTFLRTVEHRLQMEQGVRTHVVPIDAGKLEMLARRLGYTTDGDPRRRFLEDLRRHTDYVSSIFEAIFGSQENGTRAIVPAAYQRSEALDWKQAALQTAVEHLAATFHLPSDHQPPLYQHIRTALDETLNPDRALKNLSAFAASLHHALSEPGEAREEDRPSTTEFMNALGKLLVFFGVSQFFSQLLLSNPLLVKRLARAADAEVRSSSDYARALRASLADVPRELSLRMAALRRRWHEELLHIGYLDVTGALSLRQTNLLQTALAKASLEIACELAMNQLESKYGRIEAQPRYVLLGLGRLGHNGMDYGSDLDLIFVYDDEQGGPVAQASPQEVHTYLVEQIVHILSAITREGQMYRVDLRLRPDGSSGPLVHSRTSFLEYLRDKAATWEHLAYLKAYPVAGDAALGEIAHRELQEILLTVHQDRLPDLAREVHEMRLRLETEKASGTAKRNIKFGRGGMLDVYFATRYLQLKHQIPEPTERGTLQLIAYLGARGVLSQAQQHTLYEGYAFLRRTDHALRLLFDRPKDVLPANRVHLQNLARLLKYDSVEQFIEDYQRHTTDIRRVYEEIVMGSQ
jgi:glutamate-ammonia-ligase adenylyltransferase